MVYTGLEHLTTGELCVEALCLKSDEPFVVALVSRLIDVIEERESLKDHVDALRFTLNETKKGGVL